VDFLDEYANATYLDPPESNVIVVKCHFYPIDFCHQSFYFSPEKKNKQELNKDEKNLMTAFI